MNPAANQTNPDSLFEKSFEKQKEFEQPEVIDTSISYSDEHLKSFRNDWVELLNRKTDTTIETSADTVEIQQKTVETRFSQPLRIFDKEPAQINTKPVFAIEDQKGSDSAFVEIWANMNLGGKAKELGKSLLGSLAIFGELFMDLAKFVSPKKEKTEQVETDPQKAKAASEKKAENQRKRNNMSVFIQAMQAQIRAIVSPDTVRIETQEKENINKTVKLNLSYRGIKDALGRLTIYAASMFEREQLDQERQAKKQEKEQKMASATGKGPDLNLDKVAEGGFLSSTGGQGAG